MSLVKPLIKSELMSLLHFTTEGPQTIVDKDLLPIVSLKYSTSSQNTFIFGKKKYIMARNILLTHIFQYNQVIPCG